MLEYFRYIYVIQTHVSHFVLGHYDPDVRTL